MTNFDKLSQLCEDQGRLILTSQSRRNKSIVISECGTYEAIDCSIGGKDTLEAYAKLLLDKLEKESKLSNLISIDFGGEDKTSDYYIIPRDVK